MSLSPKQITTRFNHAAATYDEVASLQREMANALLSRFEKGSPESTLQIADLGCGTGHLLGQLSQRGFLKLHGFDIACNMLATARSSMPNGSTKFTEADLQALPVADEHFDVLFSNAAIQWCDTERAAAEIHRVLRPGGRGFISTFGPRTLQQWRSVFESHGHSSVHSFESTSQLTETFENTGLRLNQVETRLNTQSFHNVKDMFDSIKKLGASNATFQRKPISKSVFQSIHAEFQRRLTSAGVLKLTFEAISFEAIRSYSKPFEATRS